MAAYAVLMMGMVVVAVVKVSKGRGEADSLGEPGDGSSLKQRCRRETMRQEASVCP